ncbi:MAG: DUF386 domain-containing protein [Planctomycetota bacterium]|nr:MAG: DUF386 domain-containing protein [Planctomycetota bacterium]
MILDELQRADRYAALHPGFEAGFAFLKRPNLLDLATGRHEIDGERVFALLNRDPGRGREASRLEAHRRYIDIQFLIDGNEEIGWRPTSDCREVSEPYDEARDVGFFAEAPLTWIVLPRGSFMVFYPEDAHAPLASQGDNVKAVIKVAV